MKLIARCQPSHCLRGLVINRTGSHHPNSGNRPQGFTLFSEHCQEEFLNASVSQGSDGLQDSEEWNECILKAYSGRE